jgi:hypothetical protein
MFDRVEFIEEGTRVVNKKKFIYFVFESRVNGNRADIGQNDAVTRYTHLQYLIEPKRTLVFSFSCPKRERPNWESTAKSIMNSIKVK